MDDIKRDLQASERPGPTDVGCHSVVARVLASLTLLVGIAYAAPSTTALAASATPQAAPAPVQPLSAKPSSTQPYMACPAPAPRHASCLAVIVPAAAKLASESPFSASPATGGVDGSGLTPSETRRLTSCPPRRLALARRLRSLMPTTTRALNRILPPTAPPMVSDPAPLLTAASPRSTRPAAAATRRQNPTGTWRSHSMWTWSPQSVRNATSSSSRRTRSAVRPDDGGERGGDARRHRDQQQLGDVRVQRRDIIRLGLCSSGHPRHGGERRLGLRRS